MPLPLAIAPIGAGLAKLTTALKGLGAAKQLAIPGLKAATAGGGKMGAVKKFAGDALTKYMGPGGVTPVNVATNFAPDLIFGAMQGAMTPGDLGDKLIAGTTTAVGGALGGVGAVSAMGKFGQTGGGRVLAEMGGGMLGDMGGQMVGDVVLRAKGGGTTPFEKLQQGADQEYRQQLERQILAAYGIGGYNQTDLIGM
jgi:hypothetical protein